MIIPLYSTAAKKGLKCSPKSNKGLWFNKFVRWDGRWRKGYTGVELDLSRPELPMSIGISLLEEYNQRMRRMVQARDGLCVEVVNTSPFVTGLGLPHPTETSLVWHHTLGLPYLPGSSLKGVVRAWAADNAKPPELITAIFGEPGEEDGDGGAGGVCFMDMLPLGQVRLQWEVMTPHYNWSGPGGVPGDWQEPTPIHFLVVAANNRFQLCLLPSDSGGEPQLLSTALKWTLSALAAEGAGAKTFALGFGRFRRVDDSSGRVETTQLAGRDVKLNKGDVLTARVKEERGRRGRRKWWVELPGGGEGVVVNSGDVPEGLKPGKEIRVEVAAVPSVSRFEPVVVRYIPESDS